MAEERPESPTTAVRIYIAGLALACAFRAVDHYEWPWTTDSAVSAGLSAMLTVGDWKLPWILQKAGPRATRLLNLLAADPRWWVASILIYLMVVTLSPFIEEKRWPFSAWFASAPLANMVPKADYDALNEKVEKENKLVESNQSALASTRRTLDETRTERDQSRQQLATVQSQLQDMTHQRDVARQAAHQPPPPPPPADQTPIRWNPDFQMLWSGVGEEIQFNAFRFIGESTALAHIKDAYIISNLTGHTQQLQVFTPYNGDHIPISQIEPIPTGATVWLVVEWKPPVPLANLLSQWANFQFHVIYDDHEYKYSFDEDFINQKMAREMSGAYGPRVTKKKSEK